MLFWPASISTNCSDLLAIQKTRMDDLSSGQSCQDIAQNSVTDLAPVNTTQQKQLTEETNAFEITGGDFSGAHVGPQTYNLTRQGIVGGNFEGANFGAQNIQQIFNNTYVTQAATESERTETREAIKKEGNTDFIDLSDSIRICKTKPLCKHGNVFYGEQTSDICDARAIAVKLIPYNEENVKEAKTLLKLSSHPNVVRIIHSATYHHSLYMYIAMELCQTLNLHDHIISNRHAAFDAEKSLSWARQVTEAIDHIHKNRILHRDLKPHNILISVGHNMLKISDFGLSKELRSGRSVTAQSSRRAGTDGYRAPETYNSDLISQQADIFSLGLVVFFIWSNGSHPYGDDPDDWNSNIKRDRNRNLDNLLIPNAVTARILLSCMLQFDPRMRPTAEKVLKHKAFTAKEDEYGEFIPPITLQRQSERLPGNSFRDNAQSRPLPPVLRTTSWDTSSWNRPMRGSDADDLYVASFAYRGVEMEDLDFDEGDKLRVVVKSGRWWYATSLSSNKTGYIPSNYVVRVNNHDSYPWYFGKISRKIATALLELPGTQSGTFLVRESESGSGEY